MKKIPMRKDIVSGRMFPKQDLLRIVRTPNGEIVFDETSKINGRGAYIEMKMDVIDKVQKSKQLEKVFQKKISPDLFDEMRQFSEHMIARRQLLSEKND